MTRVGAPFYRPRRRWHLVPRRLVEVGAALLAVWVFYAFVFSDYGLQKLLELRAEEDALTVEIASLREKKGALDEQKEAIQRDPKTLERVARERFQLGREGERTYIFVPVDSLGAPVEPEPVLPGVAKPEGESGAARRAAAQAARGVKSAPK